MTDARTEAKAAPIMPDAAVRLYRGLRERPLDRRDTSVAAIAIGAGLAVVSSLFDRAGWETKPNRTR